MKTETLATATDTALQLLTPLEQEVKALIVETHELVIVDFNDQAGHDVVHKGLMKHVELRVRIEKQAKALREPLSAAVKAIIAKEKELLEPQATEEARLKTIRDAYRNHQEQLKIEAENRERLRIQSMTAKLFDLGLTFDGTRYSIQHEDEIFEITDTGIRLCDEQDFANHLVTIDAIKVQIEKAAALAAKLKAEAEESERKRAEAIAAKEAEIARREAELARRDAEILERKQADRERVLAPYLEHITHYKESLALPDDDFEACVENLRVVKARVDAQRLANEAARAEQIAIDARNKAQQEAQAQIDAANAAAQKVIDDAAVKEQAELEAKHEAAMAEQRANEAEAARLAATAPKQLIIDWVNGFHIDGIGSCAENFSEAEIKTTTTIMSQFMKYKEWAITHTNKLP
jgi:hypothetical protein